MSEPVDGWLERGGVGLHYIEWGPDEHSRGERPLLLLHGLSSNARYWDRLAGKLPGHRIVALDQRGHGLTGRSPREPSASGGYAMDQLLDAYEAANRDQSMVGRMWVIEHAFIARPDHYPRMRALGLAISAQDHLYLAAPSMKAYWGPQRAENVTPMATFRVVTRSSPCRLR